LPLNFALRLKDETRVLHRQAEQTRFMQLLIGGEIDLLAYRTLHRNFLAIYSALEPALARHSKHALLAPTYCVDLFRSATLERDLRDLDREQSGSADACGLPVPATLVYAKRLGELDKAAPDLLLAHAYVRYLGDLNGGQRLRPIIANALMLHGGTGTSFYDFGGPARTAALLNQFRRELASMEPDIECADAIVAEARWAFAQHIQMFDQISAMQ
jgi:heme oxygenase (biliverdin-producing, ferredoxin)